ncbi:peptide chain release factor N(5)-glutamine methyltransferase [Anaeromicropila herbilytica]|uniref:Release factor glutamine methyltransferase n=1 Tax=Anaeromicropila herbilytica TaxID=2785025 RepID=A0A7R7ID58_9FIRM|nr:peptide chain release factor N(5)-glutamine methyltransferase [Anaeromicropila herbilytica]BCN29693.1 release factor glutamine methyltransferase [Anaeromicropila herbilytica]
MKSLEDVYKDGENLLCKSEITDAKLDAWYLMEYVFHINRIEYYMNPKKDIDDSLYEKYMRYIKERAKHIPLQHIIGVAEFMGMEYIVSPDVLIPRQDTECLILEVLKYANNKSVLDMCTGSSCIITSLAKLCHLKCAVGVDISLRALEIAKKNIKKHNVNVELIQSNLFDRIEGRFDIIVSNPPYIKSEVINELMPEVKDHEPITALDGFEDGLYFYREIIKVAKNYLTEGGMIFFEIGHDQGDEVKRLLEESDYHSVQILKDLAGLDRVVFANL